MTPPLSPAIQGALEGFASRMLRRFGQRLRFVRLFGSFARGEAHEESDVDVAVVVEGLTREEWRAAIDDSVDVALDSGVTLSPYVVSGEHFDHLLRRERRLPSDILTEGIAL